MKDIKEYLNVEEIHEGWTGSEGDKAFDKILGVWENMSQEDILIMIWKYFSQDQLENLYKWMKQDEYFN